MHAHQTIQVIDSHTGGEPTRVVVSGGPPLKTSCLAEMRDEFRREHDVFRRAVVCEPRGSDVLVGALLCPPSDSHCVAGVIFFNNVGYLGMCGHGTIGVVATLAHLGRIGPGRYGLDTPVGKVDFEYQERGRTRFWNVPSYRLAHRQVIDLPGHGPLHGDIAWGGNWFFLVDDHKQLLEPSRVDQLTDFTWRIRQALRQQRVTGADGGEIDHIELMAPPTNPDTDARNFVLCPGGAYDRSPCGTGTSAKVACLVADGKFGPGQRWRQEGILGSVFEAQVEMRNEAIIPVITGSAHVTATAELQLDPKDPFCWGIPR